MPDEGRERRKELISKIEEKRDSKLITYVTGDRPGLQMQIAQDAIPILYQHILECRKDDKCKFDLLLYSRGGHSDVPWGIVSMFRECSPNGTFSVLIPYRAHSAATLIALGADEIIMTEKGELGPVDATTYGPYNEKDPKSGLPLPISVEDVKGYFSLLNKNVGGGRAEEQLKSFELLTSKVHPLALGTVNRRLDETRLVAERLLKTRKEPFADDVNQDIANKLSSEIYSHDHTIGRTEAMEYVGLKQVKRAEGAGIDKELWALYCEYRNLFDLEKPFTAEAELVEQNIDQNQWNGLKVACVESAHRFDLLTHNLKVSFGRMIPPQFMINMTAPFQPVINIPNLPPNLPPDVILQLIQQTVERVVQQALNNAAQVAIRELQRSLPIAMVSRQMMSGSGWNRVE